MFLFCPFSKAFIRSFGRDFPCFRKLKIAFFGATFLGRRKKVGGEEPRPHGAPVSPVVSRTPSIVSN